MSVSRETSEQLQQFAALVRRWNSHINLVSPTTLPFLEERHIQDSVQVADAVQSANTWVDLGSGGGFPGLIVSMVKPSARVILIESDLRKAVFLRKAIWEFALNAEVVDQRIEQVQPLRGNVVSARALAPLPKLIPLALRHGAPDTTYVFPKGVSYQQEITEAQATWDFDIDVRPSKVNKEGVILLMRNIERV